MKRDEFIEKLIDMKEKDLLEFIQKNGKDPKSISPITRSKPEVDNILNTNNSNVNQYQ